MIFLLSSDQNQHFMNRAEIWPIFWFRISTNIPYFGVGWEWEGDANPGLLGTGRL